jgi:peptidyl-prolyl cis-trans isomerase C
MVAVNGVAIAEDDIAREMAHHADAEDPRGAASRALCVRELLLQRARALGIAGASEDEVIDRLIEREVRTPEPADEECERYYDRHPERFTSGELVEARHILFAVTPRAPVAAIRAKAEAVLREVRADPARFSLLAQENSNCPSGANGGNLGQLSRGEAVPEFESAIFGAKAAGILPRLVSTRYGFHVVQIERSIPGRTLPFDVVRARIANALREQVRHTALRQYVRMLAGDADIAGIDLDAATSPLVQ